MDENAPSKPRQRDEHSDEQPNASRRGFLLATVGTGLAGLGVGTAAGTEPADTIEFRVAERTPESVTTDAGTVGADWSGQGNVAVTSESSVDIEWELTATDGLRLDHYEVSVVPDDSSDGEPAQMKTLDAGTTAVTIDGLKPGTKYEIYVAGIDESGVTFDVTKDVVTTVREVGSDLTLETFSTTREHGDLMHYDPVSVYEPVVEVDTTNGETTVTVEEMYVSRGSRMRIELVSARFEDGRLELAVKRTDATSVPDTTTIVSVQATTRVSVPERPDEIATRFKSAKWFPWRQIWNQAEGTLVLLGPYDISVVKTGQTSLDLRWIPDDHFTDAGNEGKYVITINGEETLAVDGWKTAHVDGEGKDSPDYRRATIGGLSPATDYEIGIRSVAADGNKSSTWTVTATTDPVEVSGVESAEFETKKERDLAIDSFLGVGGENRQTVQFAQGDSVHPCDNLVLENVSFDGETFRIVVGEVKEKPRPCPTEMAVRIIYEAEFTLATTPDRVVLERAGRGEVDVWEADDEALPPVDGTVPQDIDGDGQYMDLNANGRIDSDDVATYFEHTDAPALTDNTDAYDYNDNGRIDFDDVKQLFDEA